MSMQPKPTADQVFKSRHAIMAQLNQILDFYDTDKREQEAQINGLTRKIKELEPNLKKKD